MLYLPPYTSYCPSFVVLTLFPEMFPGPLSLSITGRALHQDLWQIHPLNLRQFAHDKHQTVDDTPYGGGAGMVLRPDIVHSALTHAQEIVPQALNIYMSPRGRPISMAQLRHWCSLRKDFIILCGRYEGVDQRVLDKGNFIEVSVGDAVVTGGELPAMMLMDAIIRLIPGALGDHMSAQQESFEGNLLEYPHYTRPLSFLGEEVPSVLRSGHHQAIEAWRHQKSCEITRERRPDLWAKQVDYAINTLGFTDFS